MPKTKFKKEDMIDLSEKEVKKMFAYCKAGPVTKQDDILTSHFLSTIDSSLYPKFTFQYDRNKLKKYRQKVLFLLGQTKAIHENRGVIYAEEGAVKYDDTYWTTDSELIIKLFALANVESAVATAGIRDNKLFFTGVKQLVAKPTVSPNDPKLSEYVEEITAQE